jgi:hypothetical protein
MWFPLGSSMTEDRGFHSADLGRSVVEGAPVAYVDVVDQHPERQFSRVSRKKESVSYAPITMEEKSR